MERKKIMSEKQSLNHSEIEEITFAMSSDPVDDQPNHGISHVRRVQDLYLDKEYILHWMSGDKNASAKIIVHPGSGRGMLVFEFTTERGSLCFKPFVELGLRVSPTGKWSNWAWLEDPSKKIRINN